MKKKGLIISLLLLFIFSIQVNSNDKFKRITFPDLEPNFNGTLTNSAENKYPADTIFVDFTSTYLLADSFIVSLRFDSVAGKYGWRKGDSLGITKLQITYQPRITYPTSNLFGQGNYATKDTIISLSRTSFVDSALSRGSFRNYVAPIKFGQYFIIIRHNTPDTASANPQATTNYKGRIGVKKTDPF